MEKHADIHRLTRRYNVGCSHLHELRGYTGWRWYFSEPGVVENAVADLLSCPGGIAGMGRTGSVALPVVGCNRITLRTGLVYPGTLVSIDGIPTFRITAKDDGSGTHIPDPITNIIGDN